MELHSRTLTFPVAIFQVPAAFLAIIGQVRDNHQVGGQEWW